VNGSAGRGRDLNPGVGFDWGIAGARATAEAAGPDGVLVVVDVLSFSTAVTIATGRGTAVYPQPWPPGDVQSFAAARGAVLAAGRDEVSERRPWSLSPAHLARAPAPGRLVLPSPNGSAISAASTGLVLAGCLRNATAVARWLEVHGFGTPDRPVTVIAAGEHWPGGEPHPGREPQPGGGPQPGREHQPGGEHQAGGGYLPAGQLRPALEDLLGAAAIIATLGRHVPRSAEATATEAVWHEHRGHVAGLLGDCVSGRELTARGFAADVSLAAEHDAQDTVPVLTDGAFRAGVTVPP
jgi:2-phosphosulfolactate phosphatase